MRRGRRGRPVWERRAVWVCGAALAAAAVWGAGAPARAQTPTPLCGPAIAAQQTAPLPIAAAALSKERLQVVVYGSSSTAGVGAGAPSAAYPAAFERAFEALSGADIDVEARGVGGEDAAGALRRLRAGLDGAPADLIIWQVGTNDALGPHPLDRFDQALRDGAAATRRAGADLVLIDPQHFPRIDGQARYAAFVAAVAQVGDAIGAPVTPRFDRMAAVYARRGAALLARDRFHMSAEGHRCLAEDLAAIVWAGVTNASR